MPFRCSKKFRFSAAHALTQLPESHKCQAMHGHNYEVAVTLESDKLHLGMVVDFGEISEWWEACMKPLLDHRNLNEVPELAYLRNAGMTAEVLAKWIFVAATYEFRGRVYSVRVQETPTCWAEYIRED